MRLSGSKLRIRKPLGQALAKIQARLGVGFHERFCGTLAVSRGLLDAGGRPGRATDRDPCLVALWKGVRDGSFDPPATLSRDEYQELRARRRELREARDPLHAFVGLFCSYGGKYWAGRLPDDNRWPGDTARYAAAKARRDVLDWRPLLALLDIACAVPYTDPASTDRLTFDDPPYHDALDHWRGESDDKDEAFDSGRFWEQVTEEALIGPHLVTEFEAPLGWSRVASWRIPSPGMRRESTEILWAPDKGVVTAAEIAKILAEPDSPPAKRQRRKS